MIELESVTKHFDGNVTTLTNDRLTSGHITIDGQSLAGLSDDELTMSVAANRRRTVSLRDGRIVEDVRR